jgi:hypothetical protein
MGFDIVEGAVCLPNIGPRERRKRLQFGLLALAGGLFLTGVLVAVSAHPLLRLGLFPVFWSAGVGIFQSREKT